MMTKALSLFELNSLVAEVIDTTISHSYWVEAELSEARENSGALLYGIDRETRRE